VKADGVSFPKELVIAANGTSLLEIKVPEKAAAGHRRLRLDWTIANVRVTPDQGLPLPMSVQVEVLPSGP
jgi:hypothetical protein